MTPTDGTLRRPMTTSRKRMRTIALSVVGGAVLVAGMAGCTSSGGNKAAAEKPAAKPSSTKPATPKAAADLDAQLPERWSFTVWGKCQGDFEAKHPAATLGETPVDIVSLPDAVSPGGQVKYYAYDRDTGEFKTAGVGTNNPIGTVTCYESAWSGTVEAMDTGTLHAGY